VSIGYVGSYNQMGAGAPQYGGSASSYYGAGAPVVPSALMGKDPYSYADAVMARYDRNRNGVIELVDIPFVSQAEVVGRARDFFVSTTPLGVVTNRDLIANYAANYIDSNRDGKIGLFERIANWFRFGVF